MKKLFTKFFMCTFIISACNQEINMKEPQPKQIPFKNGNAMAMSE